jgi:hypothetical protein
MNYLQIYKNTVSEALQSIYTDGRDIDPAVTNRIVFCIRAYFVAYCYVATRVKQNLDKPLTLGYCMEWIGKNFSYDSPFLYLYKTTIKQINDIASCHLLKLDKESMSCNIGILYESLLHTDIKETSIVDGDNSRNKQGSYYSPEILATKLTKTVIDRYVEKNGLDALLSARIIDFSCGSGIFLIEAIRYTSQLLNLPIVECKSLINNIYACDVDFIALEICKFNIVDLVSDNNAYSILSPHFKHGNFLLSAECENNSNTKIEAYLHGFLYHSDLAIGMDYLTEYDIILGNPPWEKIRFEEKNFYSQYVASIGDVNFKFELAQAINDAERLNKGLKEYVVCCKKQIESAKITIKSSGRFNASATGELNTSNLFTEAAYNMMTERSVVGLIVKSSTVATKASKPLFEKISSNIVSISDFINRKRYFNIDGRERFALLTMDGHENDSFLLSMNIQDVDDIDKGQIKITKADLSLLNPSTGMIPNLSSSKDLMILMALYKRFRTVSVEFPQLKYGRLVHFTNHASDIDKEKHSDNVPVYEAKFFSSFDGRYAGFNNVAVDDRYKSKAHAGKLSAEDKKKQCYPEPRFYIKTKKWESLSSTYHAKFMLAWHSLTSASNSRACVATILPFIPASQSVQFLITDNDEELAYLTCMFNSVVFDYIIKNKLTGIDLTQSFINQVALPSIDDAKTCSITYNESTTSAFSLLLLICKLLLRDDKRLKDFMPSMQKNTSNLPTKRQELLMLMDALVAILYHISSEEFRYIFESYSNYTPKEIRQMQGNIIHLQG